MTNLVFALVLTLIASYSCTPLVWEEIIIRGLANSRWLAGSAFADGKLFIFGGQGNIVGGINGTGILGDTWMVDIAGSRTWEPVSPSSAPSPRYGFVSGVVNNYWIISHGCNLDRCFSDTWAMDLSAMTPQWFNLIQPAAGSNTSDDVPIPEARLTAAGGVYPGSNQLWLSMGEGQSGRKLSDTWVLQVNNTDDSIAGTWVEVSEGGGLNQYHPFLPHARSLHTGAPINTSTFAIFGGCASGGQVGGPCPLQDSWLLDLETSEWESFSTCATPSVRSSMIMVPNHPGRAFILQGDSNYSPGVFPQLIVPLNQSDTELYIMNVGERNANLSDWKRVVNAVGVYPDRREGASLTLDVSGGVVYLVGGRTIEDPTFRIDVWRLSGDGEREQDQNCPAPQFTFVHLHGMLMYVAWGLLLPLGSLLGRYYRWTWPYWFFLHILCQSAGLLLTITGFVIIFIVGSFSSPDFPHAIVGIVLTFLLIQQFLSGIFHPCVDKENGKTSSSEKGAYRKCWEVYHGASGFISIAIGLGQVTLGVLLIDAPIAVWCVWAGLGGLWIITFIIHEFVYICYKLVHTVRRKKVY